MRQMLDPQQSLTIGVLGSIHTYIHTYTYSFTGPLSAQVELNVEFVMKRAKLQNAIKSSTRLNDGEQCLGRAFSHRCKTRLPDTGSSQQRPMLSHAACRNYTLAR